MLYSAFFVLLCFPSFFGEKLSTSFGLPRFDRKIENFCADCIALEKDHNPTVSAEELYNLCLQKQYFALHKCAGLFYIDDIVPPNFFIFHDPEEDSQYLIKKGLSKIRQMGFDSKLFFLERSLTENANQTIQVIGDTIFISNDDSWRQICEMDSLQNKHSLFYLRVSSQRLMHFINLLDRYCSSLIQERRLSIAVDTTTAFDSDTALETMQKVRSIFDPDRLLYVDKMLANPIVQAIIPFREFNTAIEDQWNAWHIQRIEIVIEEKSGPSPKILLTENPGVGRELLATSMTSILARLLVEIRHEEIKGFPLPTREDLILQTLNCLIPFTHIFNEWDETQTRFFYSNILLAEFSDLADEFLRNHTTFVSTPTFAAALLTCTFDHWKGMPILLVAGKKMATDAAYVRVIFREQPTLLHPSRQYYAPPRRPGARCLPKPRSEEIVFLLERSEACQLEPGIYCTSGLPCQRNGTYLKETFTEPWQSTGAFSNVLQLATTTTSTTERLLMYLIDSYLSPIPDVAYPVLDSGSRARWDWSKEALVEDPVTAISYQYLSLVSRIWSPLLLTRHLHRIYAIDRATDELGFHYPTGEVLPTQPPDYSPGSGFKEKPPVTFLLPLVWTQAPFVLGLHPRENWKTIIQRLADDIYYDCLNVNHLEGLSCNIAITGGRSVFGIELALRNRLREHSNRKPHITLWSASEYFTKGNRANLSKPWSLTDLDLYVARTYRLEDLGPKHLTLDEHCRRYSQKLKTEFDSGHAINWILLSMGPDGEIAGHGNCSDNNNNNNKNTSPADPVLCSEEMPPANQPGMTFSWATIAQARNKVVFVVDQTEAHAGKKISFFNRVVQPYMAHPEEKRQSFGEWLERRESGPAILHLLDAPVDGPRIIFYRSSVKP